MGRRLERAVLAFVLGAASFAGCRAADTGIDGAPPPIAAKIPADAKSFYPSQIEVPDARRGQGAEIADVGRCEPCHAEAVAAWRASPHALASFQNPLYRGSVDAFRSTTGKVESRFCGGCHDVALLVDGAMDEEISPEDPRAYAGITCEVCHGIVATRPGGNAAFTLAAEPIPIPRLDDPVSIAEHKRRAAPAPLRTPALCSTCHKAFLGSGTKHPHFFAGQDDALPFRRSIYAGDELERIDEPVARATCARCHMKRDVASLDDVSAKGGTLASHRFAASHSLLAAMRGDGVELDAIRRNLAGVASIDVAVVRHADGRVDAPAETASPSPGEALELDVVVRNEHVGHFFPGGTLDLQDTWIELDVRDAKGVLVAEAGADHAQTGADPTAHRLRAELLDEEGQPVRAHEVERFRALGYNQAVAARDAVVVSYAFQVPEVGHATLPLSVHARLRHRARVRELSEAACAASTSDRSQAFQARSGIDACALAPVFDVAEVTRSLAGQPERDDAFLRLVNHARGSLHAVQEKVFRAEPSLTRALTIAERDGSPFERAVVLSLEGDLASKEGRVDDALALFDRAERDAPGAAALDYLRGKALANVWRFAEAVPPLERAVSRAPEDDGAWSLLAIARASAGDDEGALEASLEGLALTPRHPDLLRSQALALRVLLGDADPRAASAQSSQLEHRVSDDAPDLRARCSAEVPGCAKEREPVHVHPMRQRIR
jgi:tetratricopeptide (TPR) repeat protein